MDKMVNVISYCLFDQFGEKFNRAGHDPYDNYNYRYWLNLPFILIYNDIIFHDYETWLYVPKVIQSNIYFDLLDKFSKKLPKFKLKIIDKEYKRTEPASWRIMPLWEDYVDILLIRDIDSVMTKNEIKSIRYFSSKSEYYIHTIRGLVCHNCDAASIMCGLSGFRVNDVRKHLPLPKSFEMFEHYCNSTNFGKEWGFDQIALTDFFVKSRPKQFQEKLLDHYIQPKRNCKIKGLVKENKYYCVTSQSFDKFCNTVDISDLSDDVLTIADNITTWSGEPVISNGLHLKNIIKVAKNETSKIVSDIIYSNTKYLELYKI